MATIARVFLILCIGACLPLPQSYAQNILDKYVREALRSNLVVQQKNLSLEQAQQSLRIARSYFMPSVVLSSDYISSEGGRAINIPIGDLINPVYSTLNQLTGQNSFPQIENVRQNFLPHNFYDVHVRTSVPLINTDLYFNHTIQRHQVIMKQKELEIFQRQLVVDIKTAYFNYLAATHAVKIYESARALVDKNVEINESLLKNGKSNQANYVRSKSEAEKIAADLNAARNKQTNAKMYFNFLLNRALDYEIDETFDDELLHDDDSLDADSREELEMLRLVGSISHSTLKLHKLNRLPKLNAFFDLGSQGRDWAYNSHSRYYLVGVQLSLPLFQGFRNNIMIKQDVLQSRKVELELTHTRQQLEMAAKAAANDLHTSIQNYAAAGEQLKSAERYFTIIEKGYQQGVNSLIEYLDARNQFTSSQVQRSIRCFEMLSAQARLERETASYLFETEN